MSELPAAVRRYLAAHGLPSAVALQPAAELQRARLAGHRGPHGHRARTRPSASASPAGASPRPARSSFHSGPDTPILLAFLPLHHIVAVRAGSIVAHLEDYAALAARARPPRNVNLITGASGTTDIEGSYVRGAHGPGFLHVVLVEDRAT